MWKKIPPLTKNDDRALHKKTRFLVDENIGKLASILRELGLDARSAHEAGLKGHSDEDLFALGWKRKWVIITNDKDFLNDRSYPFHRCPGVLILPSPAKGLGGFGDALANGLAVVGRYGGAFDGQKMVIGPDGTGIVRGFSKHRGLHWKVRFKVDEHYQLWERDGKK